MRLRERLALVVVGGGFLVATVGWTALSDRVVERVLRTGLTRALAAPCDFDSASFTLLEGLEVHELVVLDPRDPLGEPAVRVGSATIDYVLGIGGSGPRITQIRLDRPEIHVRELPGQTLDPRQFVRVAMDETEETPRLAEVAITGGTLSYSDPTLFAPGESLLLSDVAGTLTPIDLGTGFELELGASCELLGSVQLTARGDAEASHVELQLPSLELGPHVQEFFTGPLARTLTELESVGRGGITMRGTRPTGGELVWNLELQLQGVGASLPMPPEIEGRAPRRAIRIEDATGTVRADAREIVVERLHGVVLGASVELDGSAHGLLDDSEPTMLDVNATVGGLALEQRVLDTLPWEVLRVIEAFSVRGSVDLAVRAAGPPDDLDVEVDARLHAAQVNYVGYEDEQGVRHGFPYTVDQVQGTVEVRGALVRLDLESRHGDGVVRGVGETETLANGRTRTDVRITGTDIPLDADLRAGFEGNAPQRFDRWAPAGVLREVVVHVIEDPTLDVEPDATEVHLTLDERATFAPDYLPVRFRTPAGEVHVEYPATDGIRRELVRVEGLVCRGERFDLDVEARVTDAAERIHIQGESDEVSAALMPGVLTTRLIPEATRETLGHLRPRGSAAFEVTLTRDGQETAEHVLVRARGLSVDGLEQLPVHLDDAVGRVTVAGDSIEFDSLAGRALGGRVRVDGRVLDPGGEDLLDLRIQARDVSVGPSLREALGTVGERAAAYFDTVRPGEDARADADVTLRPTDDPTRQVHVHVGRFSGGIGPLGLALQVAEADVTFDGERVTGELRGRSASGVGSVEVLGLDVDAESGRVRLDLAGRGLHFPEDLAGPFSPEAVQGLSELMPGRLLHVRGVPEPGSTTDGSHLHLDYDPAESRLRLDGTLDLRPRARGPGAAPGLAAEGPLQFRDVEFNLLPDGLTGFEGELSLRGFQFHPGVEIRGMDADAVLHGQIDQGRLELWAFIDRGARLTALDRVVTDAQFTLEVDGEEMRVRELSGALHEGHLTGSIGVGKPRVAYRGELKLADANLAVAQGEGGASGRLDAWVRFRNRSGAIADLTGAGALSVSDARLGGVPVLAGIGRILQLDAVVGTGEGQDSGQLEFDVRGEWLRVSDLWLETQTYSVSDGEGKIGLDGRLDLAVSPRPRKVIGIPLVEQLFWQFLRIPQYANFLRVRVRGNLRNPVIEQDLLPGGPEVSDRPEPRPADPLRRRDDFPW